MNLWNNIKSIFGVKVQDTIVNCATNLVESEANDAINKHSTKTNVYVEVDVSKMKVSELRSLAKQIGLKGYTGLRKAELIKLLEKELC